MRRILLSLVLIGCGSDPSGSDGGTGTDGATGMDGTSSMDTGMMMMVDTGVDTGPLTCTMPTMKCGNACVDTSGRRQLRRVWKRAV
jgi:hypothetical protein